MIDETHIRDLQGRVVKHARFIREQQPTLSWERCLEDSAQLILDPRWSYEIAPFVGASPEPAHFFLTQYDNG